MRYFLSTCAFVALTFVVPFTPASGAPIAPPSVHQTPSAIVATGGRVAITNAAAVTAPSFTSSALGIAASQVASTGRQTLTLTKDGTASGGTMYASTLSGNYNVPQNVEAILDFSNGAPMTVNNFVNNGTVYCVSSNPNVANAAINVRSFLNGVGAQISTALSLSITSKTTFENCGTITAAGDLGITAATSVANLGTLRSQNGNVTFTGTSTAFEIGNSGHIYAPNGTITIDQRSPVRNTLNINGGQWTSKAVNINAPNSSVHFVANDISAQVNVASKALQIGALWNTPNLGTVPAKTNIIQATAPEAEPVSRLESRFSDSDYIADTDEDL